MTSASSRTILPVALCAAAVVPSLLAFNFAPSPTVFNQVAALGLWGLAAAAAGDVRHGGMAVDLRRYCTLVLAFTALALAAICASAITMRRDSSAGMLAPRSDSMIRRDTMPARPPN